MYLGMADDSSGLVKLVDSLDLFFSQLDVDGACIVNSKRN